MSQFPISNRHVLTELARASVERAPLGPTSLRSRALTLGKGIEQQILDAHRDAGIAIFDPITGFDMAGTRGFVIAPRARLRVFHPAPPTVERVSGFIRDNRHFLARPARLLGLWSEAGKHLLDVCVVIADLEEAIQFVEDSRQRQYWDLSRMGMPPQAPKQLSASTPAISWR
jgi:hypothetical protein